MRPFELAPYTASMRHKSFRGEMEAYASFFAAERDWRGSLLSRKLTACSSRPLALRQLSIARRGFQPLIPKVTEVSTGHRDDSQSTSILDSRQEQFIFDPLYSSLSIRTRWTLGICCRCVAWRDPLSKSSDRTSTSLPYSPLPQPFGEASIFLCALPSATTGVLSSTATPNGVTTLSSTNLTEPLLCPRIRPLAPLCLDATPLATRRSMRAVRSASEKGV